MDLTKPMTSRVREHGRTRHGFPRIGATLTVRHDQSLRDSPPAVGGTID